MKQTKQNVEYDFLRSDDCEFGRFFCVQPSTEPTTLLRIEPIKMLRAVSNEHYSHPCGVLCRLVEREKYQNTDRKHTCLFVTL